MSYTSLADAVLILHLCFVLFVVLGGLLVLRWRRLAWLHLPAAGWGALVEFTGWICPLTPMENTLRRAAGGEGYETTFVERYLVPLVYPGDLTREMQVVLGLLVVAVNLGVYGFLWRRARGRRA
jgi:hypothetical protein